MSMSKEKAVDSLITVIDVYVVIIRSFLLLGMMILLIVICGFINEVTEIEGESLCSVSVKRNDDGEWLQYDDKEYSCRLTNLYNEIVAIKTIDLKNELIIAYITEETIKCIVCAEEYNNQVLSSSNYINHIYVMKYSKDNHCVERNILVNTCTNLIWKDNYSLWLEMYNDYPVIFCSIGWDWSYRYEYGFSDNDYYTAMACTVDWDTKICKLLLIDEYSVYPGFPRTTLRRMSDVERINNKEVVITFGDNDTRVIDMEEIFSLGDK